MADVIGVYRALDPQESIVFETRSVVPLIFVKEAELTRLWWHPRKEAPLSYGMVNVFLSNKRLMCLILYQIMVSELSSSKTPRFARVAGTWFELPLSAVRDVQTRPASLGKRSKQFKRLIQWGLVDKDKVASLPAVEVVYEKSEATSRVREYALATLGMNFIGRSISRVDNVYDKFLLVGDEVISLVPYLRSRMHAEGEGNNLPPGEDIAASDQRPPTVLMNDET